MAQHNNRHAKLPKVISHNTMQAREQGLFRMFTLLRALGYKPRPSGLNGRHLEALVEHWTADPVAAERSRSSGASKLAPLAQPHSAAYIQQQLSILRVFAGWIGKPGMVLPAEAYVDNPALVQRSCCAKSDLSWSGNDVDIERVFSSVAKLDPFVAVQLELMLAFGLRRKEAVMFRPQLAQVPAHALPVGYPVGAQYLSFLRIKRGTKGGRLRYTAMRNPEQLRAFERALAVAPYQTSHVGRPGLSLKQALDRFSNVLRAAGVSRKLLGVTPHGLRHQFAGDLYFELTELQAPVRGGDIAGDPALVAAAYLEVARQLGHNRPAISGAYLGSRR